MIDGTGVTHGLSKSSSMLKAPELIRGRDLEQHAHALSWMPSPLPKYAEAASPLQACQLRIARAVWSAAKRSASRILLADVGWIEAEPDAFASSKRLLHNAMRLARPRPDRQMLLLSGVPDGLHATLVTMAPHEGLDLPLAEHGMSRSRACLGRSLGLPHDGP